MVIVKHNIQHPKWDRDMHLRRQNPRHSLLESPLNRGLVDIRGLLEVPHSERFLRDGAARHILMVHLPWSQEQGSEAVFPARFGTASSRYALCAPCASMIQAVMVLLSKRSPYLLRTGSCDRHRHEARPGWGEGHRVSH